MEEQGEACCSNLHRALRGLLDTPVDAHVATFGGMEAAQRMQQEHTLALLRIQRLGQLYRALIEDERDGGCPMSIVVGAGVVGIRMERAEEYRNVEAEVEMDVLFVVVESMRLIVEGRRAV